MTHKVLEFIQKKWILLLLSSLSFLAYGGLVSLDWIHGTLRDEFTPRTIGWYLVAFAAYVGLIVWNEKHPIGRRCLWGGAVLFRVMLLLTTPTLSDDIYRYIWDGYVANEGVSPYEYAIDAPELDNLEIPQRDLANNSWMASPYLPAAQVVFLGVTAVFPLQPLYLQMAMVLFDLTAAWILSKLLLLALMPGHRLFIYLWNPLVIVEVGHGAHVDAWMVLLLLGAVYFGIKQAEGKSIQRAVKGKQIEVNSKQSLFTAHRSLSTSYFSPFLLGLATLTKLLPGLLLPVLFWLWNWPQRVFYGFLVGVLLVPFGLQAGWGLTGELNGRGLFGALRIYSAQWKFNGGLHHWLELWLAKAGAADPAASAKLVSGILLLALLTVVWLLARTHTQPRPALRLMSLPLMGYLLLTPTLHPWYLLILLAFLPFLTPADDEPPFWWLLAAPWLYLSGALIFSYWTYIDPLNFGEREWVRQLEWMPTFFLLVSGAAVFLLLRQRKKEEQ